MAKSPLARSLEISSRKRLMYPKASGNDIGEVVDIRGRLPKSKNVVLNKYYELRDLNYSP